MYSREVQKKERATLVRTGTGSITRSFAETMRTWPDADSEVFRCWQTKEHNMLAKIVDRDIVSDQNSTFAAPTHEFS